MTFCCVALCLWAFWLEPASLVVHETTIELPRWPLELDGLRVAVLSDLHVGSPYNGPDRLRELIAETNAQRPDITLLAGDFVIQGVLGGSFVEPERIAQELQALQAPLGVYAVMGNHDWWLDEPWTLVEAFRVHCLPLLHNEAVAIDAAVPFWLAGIGDWTDGAPDPQRAVAGVPEGAPLLAFTHNPDVFPHVPPQVDLTIAGHTHGGQVRLPFFGPLVVPSSYGQRYAAGLIEEDGKRLFVTTGVGLSILPVRFGVPPEISVLVLRAPAQKSPPARSQ